MADQRIQATELVTGANHPTRTDTLNRLTLVAHNDDGTHKTLTGLNLVSPIITGTVTVPTPTTATDAANKGYVDSTAFNVNLPAQAGNADSWITTDGTNASWTKLLKTVSYRQDNDGSITGGTWAIDYANGPVIKATAGANITSITMANWPVTGTVGHLRLMLVNFGAYTITFPSWNWIKSDLTVTTSFGDLAIALPASGTCILDLFSDDGGTTIYASVVR